MIPEERLSSAPAPARLLNPWSMRDDVSEHWGPVAVQDTSLGLTHRLWRARIDGPHVLLSAEGVAESIIYTHPGELREVSMAFDQNGLPYLAVVDVTGAAFLRWYDPLVPGMTVTQLAAGVVNPRITLDDARPFNVANSDVILAYVRDGLLRYRRQRDRFDVEFTPPVGEDGQPAEVSILNHVSMNDGLRLEFLVDFDQSGNRPRAARSFTDRKVQLTVQRNGQVHRIATREKSLGELGEYSRRVRFNRFGQARRFDITIRVTSPCPAHLMGAAARLEVEGG